MLLNQSLLKQDSYLSLHIINSTGQSRLCHCWRPAMKCFTSVTICCKASPTPVPGRGCYWEEAACIISAVYVAMDSFRSTLIHQQDLIELRLCAIACWPIKVLMLWLEVSHGFPEPLSRIQCWRAHWRHIIECPAMVHQLEKSRAKHFGHNHMAYLVHHISEGGSSGVGHGCWAKLCGWRFRKAEHLRQCLEKEPKCWNGLPKPTDRTASCYSKVA